MPVDFTGSSAAVAVLGEGTIPKMTVEAPDISCRWNDYPIFVECEALQVGGVLDPGETWQVATWTTPLGVGPFTPPENIWPLMRVYDYHHIINQGYHLFGQMRFTVPPLGGSGFMGIANPFTGLGYSNPSLIGPNQAFDTGVVDLGGPDCFQVDCSNPVVTFGLVWFPFNPTVQDVLIDGHFEAHWVFTSSGPFADFEPCQDFTLRYVPPCDPVDTMLLPGLHVTLETDSCGSVTTSYNELASAINAYGIGMTAAAVGGHGNDPVDVQEALFDGAICSGSAGDTPGG